MMPDRIEQLKSLLLDSPDEPFILFALAQEYVKRGECDEAMTYFEKIIAAFPDYTGAYYHLGKLQEQLDKIQEAAATYQKGMEITRANGEHHAFSELQSALSLLTDGD